MCKKRCFNRSFKCVLVNYPCIKGIARMHDFQNLYNSGYINSMFTKLKPDDHTRLTTVISSSIRLREFFCTD